MFFSSFSVEAISSSFLSNNEAMGLCIMNCPLLGIVKSSSLHAMYVAALATNEPPSPVIFPLKPSIRLAISLASKTSPPSDLM